MLIILSCLGGMGGASSFVPFELLSLVARSRLVSRSFKCPYFNSSATSSRREHDIRLFGGPDLDGIRTIFWYLKRLVVISSFEVISLFPPFLLILQQVHLAQCSVCIRLV